MRLIDNFLDRITMYRLLLYYLIGLILAAIALSAFGKLQYSPTGIAFTASYITLICWITNEVFSRVFKAPVNFESVYITALILALIVGPVRSTQDLSFFTAVSGLAIASKFILAIRKKHIFNPAAVAVALTAAGPHLAASWWVGSQWLLPFVIAGGLLIVRKIRRGQMVFIYVATVLIATVAVGLVTHHHVLPELNKTLLHSSLFFLAFIMLTEPLTSPVTEPMRRWYAILTGALFPPQLHIFTIYSTPELSLLVGNVFAYVVSPKVKLLPKLKQKIRLSHSSVDFVFGLDKPLVYQPGQYMEWTLPHEHIDSRGNRRYLTLASSPTEANLRLGVKFYPDGSSYKKAMLSMGSDDVIAAGQLGGDFTLPNDPSQKLVFIAGGIGITPFRSMLKYLVDMTERRDIALLYSEKSPADFIYGDVLNEAKQRLGTRLIYTITGAKPPNWTRQTGHISENLIATTVPDFKDRLFYISGPHSMVVSVEDILHKLGVNGHQIKTDFFPGYT